MVFKDPIFSNVADGTLDQYVRNLAKVANRSLTNGASIQFYFGDGILPETLSNLKKNKSILLSNILIDCDKDLEPYIHTCNVSAYGLSYYNYQVDPCVPATREFNCFMNRYDINRQSWLYQLIRRNYIDLGHVSFQCEISANRMPNANFKGMTPNQAFEFGFQNYNQIFAKEHQQIRDKIPYCSFEDTGDLTEWILSSKFSLILETWFHDNRQITFTEKTMRCLQLPRPWLLFSTQHAVRQLKTWGFDVLDDIVDHNYDSIADPIQRQVKILDTMKSLMDINVPTIAHRCVRASEHNKSIMRDWWQNLQKNVKEDFEIARQKALAL